MSRHTLVLSGILALCLALAGCHPEQTGQFQCPVANYNVTASKDAQHVGNDPGVDAIMEELLSSTGAPGCAVGIMQNNEIAYLKAYGFSDVGNPQLLGDETDFTIATPSLVGSISKTMTALTILRLEELGFINIDAPADNYLPLSALGNITIRQLLTHQALLDREPTFWSGLNTEAELEGMFPGVEHPGIHPRLVFWAYDGITPFVAIPPQVDLDGLYSNAGYTYLGAVIDYVLQNNMAQLENLDAYESLVWRRVGLWGNSLTNADQALTPCLNEYWRENSIQDLATGYANKFCQQNLAKVCDNDGDCNGDGPCEPGTLTVRGQGDIPGPAGWEGPAGGWSMTIGDLVRLMMAIQNNSIVSQSTKDEMTCAHGELDVGTYGLGLFPIKKSGKRVYLHGGAYPGYSARYIVWPEYDFGIAAFCNLEKVSDNLIGVTDDIAALFLPGGSDANWPTCSARAAARERGGEDDPEQGDPDLTSRTGDVPPPPIPPDQQSRLLAGLLDPTVRCLDQPATIIGTEFDDTIVGTPEDDVIHGLGGRDIVLGDAGNDIICGGPGDDTLDGQGGDDKLFDDDGANTLLGGDGIDTLSVKGSGNTLEGGAGDDVLGVQGDDNILDGGPGNDALGAIGSNNELLGGEGEDQVGTIGEGNDVCDDPASQGYWHRQCLGVPASQGGIDPGRNGRGPQQPTEPGFWPDLMDCAFLELEDLGFFGTTTCEGLDADPPNDPCEKADKQFTALILNVCSGRLSDGCGIDVSALGCSSTTVGDLIVEVGGLILGGNCQPAADCAAGVNEGSAFAGGGNRSAGAPDSKTRGFAKPAKR